MTSRIIADCVTSDSPLGRLQAHAQKLVRLQRVLTLLLPNYLQEAVAVANLQKGILSLHCSNNATAAKLRLLLPRVKEGLWVQGIAVDDIKTRIRIAHPASSPYRRPPVREIAERNLADLDALRQRLPADSPLAEPLARLLAHAVRKKTIPG